MENYKLTIMGSEYQVIFDDKFDEKMPELSGFFDPTSKEIHVLEIQPKEDYGLECQDVVVAMKATLRHEIIHAFLFESGLWCDSMPLHSGWAMNEEMVDWFALQAPKIYDCFEKAKCI